MKVHIVAGFPDKVSDDFLTKLYASIGTDKAHADRAAAYYRQFYGGLRDVRVLSFKVEDDG